MSAQGRGAPSMPGVAYLPDSGEHTISLRPGDRTEPREGT
jgi:hypothetical protein